MGENGQESLSNLQEELAAAQERIAELEAENRRLSRDAYQDRLTKAPNDRFFLLELEGYYERAQKGLKGYLEIGYIDIDNLTIMNKTGGLGEKFTDRVLQWFFERLRHELPQEGITVGRWRKGDEAWTLRFKEGKFPSDYDPQGNESLDPTLEKAVKELVRNCENGEISFRDFLGKEMFSRLDLVSREVKDTLYPPTIEMFTFGVDLALVQTMDLEAFRSLIVEKFYSASDVVEERKSVTRTKGANFNG